MGGWVSLGGWVAWPVLRQPQNDPPPPLQLLSKGLVRDRTTHNEHKKHATQGQRWDILAVTMNPPPRLCLVGGGGQGGFLVRSLVDGAGSYSVAHRAGLLPTELTGMWGWILLRSPHRGSGSAPSPRPPLGKGLTPPPPPFPDWLKPGFHANKPTRRPGFVPPPPPPCDALSAASNTSASPSRPPPPLTSPVYLALQLHLVATDPAVDGGTRFRFLVHSAEVSQVPALEGAGVRA